MTVNAGYAPERNILRRPLRLLGELMIRDGSNLAAGTALLKRLHFNKDRDLLLGVNNHPDSQLRCHSILQMCAYDAFACCAVTSCQLHPASMPLRYKEQTSCVLCACGNSYLWLHLTPGGMHLFGTVEFVARW